MWCLFISWRQFKKTKMKEIKMSFKINTTQEFLNERGISFDDIKEDITFLSSIFGTKYFDLFPNEIATSDIDYISYCSNILRSIRDCEGFKEHIKEYNQKNKHAHLYSARVARFFLQRGFKVTLEPDMGKKDGPHPDLKIEKENTICYVECKTSNISNYFKKSLKKEVADLVYEKIKTSDQIDLFFEKPIERRKVQELLNDDRLIKQVHLCFEQGNDGKETALEIIENLKINVIQRPAIIGSENDFPEVTMEMYMENNTTKTRSLGYAFLKGGRSIGVYDVVDYSNKLKDKKEQSEKQLISSYPNIVFIRDSDVVGDPNMHKHYIESEWLTPELAECSGVVIFDNYDSPYNSIESENFKYYKNINAIIDFDI